MHEIGEEEADELEKEGDEDVEAEDPDGAGGQIVDDHVTVCVWSGRRMDGRFPVWGYCIRLGICI